MHFYPRVSIQSSDDFALPDEFGMDVFPSTTTNFAIRQVCHWSLAMWFTVLKPVSQNSKAKEYEILLEFLE